MEHSSWGLLNPPEEEEERAGEKQSIHCSHVGLVRSKVEEDGGEPKEASR